MLNKFIKWLQINKDSKKTINTYYSLVKSFLSWSDNKYDQESINAYLHERRKDSKSTFNSTIYALNAFNECFNLNIKLPKTLKTEKKIKVYYTEEELKQDIQSMLSLIFRDWERNSLIIDLMFYTGLRVSEIANLKSKDVDFNQNIIIVKNTKGKKERIVPIYFKQVAERLKKFIDEDKETIFDMTVSNIQYIFKKIHKELQLRKPFNPHIMRHSYAKHLLKKGIGLENIQKLLGHGDIKTTMIYAEPDEQMVIEALKKIEC